MQKEVKTHTHTHKKKKYIRIKYETFHIIFVMALYPLKYHNHITLNQWILHLTYIYQGMNIKPQLIEVYAIKNKSIITYSCGQSYTSYSKTQNLRIITKATSFISYGKPKIKQPSSLTTVPRTMQNQLHNTHASSF